MDQLVTKYKPGVDRLASAASIVSERSSLFQNGLPPSVA
jgi:hypothetical protein